MESVLPPPPPFAFVNNMENVTSGNISKEWEKWKSAFMIYFDACELNKKDQKVQVSIFLHIVGEQCREVYDQFKETCKDITSVIKKFDDLFLLKKNLTVQRHHFFTRDQLDGETIEQYSFELRKLASKCEFKDLCDDLVRDRLICGIKENALRERLLREPDLTLQKSLDICNIAQLSKVHAGNIKKESVEHRAYAVENRENEIQDCNGSICTAHWIAKRGHPSNRNRGASRGRAPGPGPSHAQWPRASPNTYNYPSPPQIQKKQSLQRIEQCSKCGITHIKNKCPAYGKRCLKCNKVNHFSRVCNYNNVYEVQNDESSDQVIFYFNKSNSDWCVKLLLNCKEISFKIDTGADVNVLPRSYLKEIGISDSELVKTSIVLRGYSGSDIKVMGKCDLKIKFRDCDHILNFIVADVNSPPILGRQSSQELNIVKLILSLNENSETNDLKNRIFSEFSDVFEGIGCMPGVYKIGLDECVRPVVHAPRKLPVALKDSVKNKLDEMVKDNIIAKVSGPTDWVNSMTVVRKPNGDLRICLDPRDLNKAIKREHFNLPTLDEITVKLAGAKYFSTVDAKNGFWQQKLHDDSTDLCTFNTAFGRYKFLRLPYGITSASEVFHKKMYEHFDDIEGVCLFVDDILIFGKTRFEHDSRLIKVLNRCREINLKLNKNKCKIGLTEIKYLGHKITPQGIYPDNSHTTAISKMQPPSNSKDLERFLGLVNYIGRFVPNLSEKTHCLRQLLKKDVEWHWMPFHQKSFENLKKCLINVPVLQYYSLDKPVIISVDASKNGLGACLLQNSLPVSYASRSLTKAEQNYAQIEKELLACVYACEKFYTYIYGRNNVTIETDHKPLVSIINKPIASAPARLQRMLLRLQLYSFNLVYKPGKYLFIADTLSRAAEPVCYRELQARERDHFDAQAQVCAVTACNPLTDTHFIRLQKETHNDQELQLLIKYITEGWPEHKQEVSDEVRPYWCYKEDLSVSYGIVWKGNRVVIPKNMRREMLSNVHVGHLGLEKCKLRVRDTMFWPNLNTQLQDYISNCQACLTHKNQNRKETLISHDIPNRAWSKVGTDTFHFNGQVYLLIVDYYSKFIEVIKLQNLTSNEIINQLKIVFSRQGIPEILMSDNGPEYSSSDFKAFSQQWCFRHVTSSPCYPQSNGQAERMVQTVKQILKKTLHGKTDFRLGLLEYLNTPINTNLASPSELLNNRKLRSIIPCSPKLLKAKIPKHVKNELNLRQEKQRLHYNKGARDLSQLNVGQHVKVRINKFWVSGIIDSLVGTRSYAVKIQNGGILIRNRRHLIIDGNLRSNSSADRYNDDTYSYDDVTARNVSQNPFAQVTVNTEPYITRFGRSVRRPDRWGYNTSSV